MKNHLMERQMLFSKGRDLLGFVAHAAQLTISFLLLGLLFLGCVCLWHAIFGEYNLQGPISVYAALGVALITLSAMALALQRGPKGDNWSGGVFLILLFFSLMLGMFNGFFGSFSDSMVATISSSVIKIAVVGLALWFTRHLLTKLEAK